MEQVAKELQCKIKNELTERLVSIKIDSATRLKRSVLGINAQFIFEGKIIIRTLAMLELKEKHTGDYMASEIQNVLNKYGMELRNVYTVTSDNGANMLKAIKTLGERLLNENVRDTEHDVDSQEGNFEISEGEENDILIDEEEELLVDTLNSLVSLHPNNYKIYSVRCASHTLQLAIIDSLKGEDKTLSLIRAFVKKLRTPSGILLIKQHKHLLIPPLDCITRWSSTFHMLDIILKYQTDYNNIAISMDVKIQPNNWAKIEQIRDALTLAARATTLFQAEQLVLTDVYKEWMKCKLATAKFNSEFAKALLKNLNLREPNILNNIIMKSAIFLDPRFQAVLAVADRTEVKAHLKEIWTNNKGIAGQEGNPEIDALAQNTNNLDNFTSSDDEFENLKEISTYIPYLLHLNNKELIF